MIQSFPAFQYWNNHPLAICALDPHLKIQYVNRACLRFFKKKKSDCIGRSIDQILLDASNGLSAFLKGKLNGASSESFFLLEQKDCALQVFANSAEAKEGNGPIQVVFVSSPAASHEVVSSEADYMNAFRSGPHMLWVWQGDYKRVLYVNDAYEKIWDQKISDLLRNPQSYLEAVNVNDRALLLNAMVDFKSDLFTDSGLEFRLRERDGFHKFVWAHCWRVGEDIAGTVVDISKQKKDIIFGKNILESLPNLNYIVDLEEQKITYRGGKGYELLGYSREFMENAPSDFFIKRLHPANTEKWPKYIALWASANDKEVLKTEFRLQDSQGNWRWFISADKVYSRTRDGRVKEIICTAQEITERKLMEEERRKSDERFKKYFDLGLIGMVVSSLNKEIIVANDYFCNMLGYHREELIKKTWTELTDPEDLETDLMQFNRLLAGEIESYTLDKRFLRKDGEPVFTSIAISCVRKETGEPDHVLALIQDISERKQTERELGQYRDHLEELVKARTAELYEANEKLRLEILERRIVEENLQKKNIALNEILGQIEIEKKAVREQIVANVERLLLPIIKKLGVDDKNLRQDYITLLTRNLKEMTSSFGVNISNQFYRLTPREIEICNMIKSRLSNKEISRLLNVSLRTVETHRNDIRKKLNLAHKKINLATYLQAL